MQEPVATMNAKFNQLLAHPNFDQGETSVGQTRTQRTPAFNRNVIPKLTKLEFPKYTSGDDPTSWICRVEQFFKFQQIEPEKKVSLAAYHLEVQSNILDTLHVDHQVHPQAILDRKKAKRRWFLLVHWQDHSPAEATCEDMHEFTIRLPQFALESKGVPVGEENDVDQGQVLGIDLLAPYFSLG
ncbi:hypothetical protein F0562_007561 [Nyssa sinensis]|uniref:Chromo domain-containing protein n=1 Tax=Nyssa sinensis TaxID=561372 RepID=A0A5J5A6X4_9ASTE|nr:hypothetical protein F0562_007561 [Nyssa sinensis]